MTICRVELRLEFYHLHRYRRHGLGPMRNGELEVRPPPTQGNHKEAFCLSRALHGGGQRGRVSCEKSNPRPVQCEIQIYTILKCGFPKPRNLT